MLTVSIDMDFERKEITDSLPCELKKIVGTKVGRENFAGCSNSRNFHIEGILEGRNAFLKIVQGHLRKELERECLIYKWVRGKLPVPEVFYFGLHRERAYLLVSEIEGVEASSSRFSSDPENMVRILAHGLKMIHSVEISNCPFDRNIETKMKEARFNIANGLVDVEDLQPENRGKTAEEILQMLEDKKPKSEDLVFTHGDYCLPNVIINGNELSGFIDMGRGGVADRYQDLALAYRSIKYNLPPDNQEGCLRLFFKKYGVTEIDYSKIQYYVLLDELF
jgi:aminoglycoside phosphotransferase